MRHARTVARTVVRRTVLLLAVLLGTLVPSAAQAADELGVSNDGVRWHGTLDPLFDESVRWVPGDVRTATFFVRNQGDDAGRLDVDLLARSGGALLGTGDLTVAARAGSGSWTSTDDGDRQGLVVDARLPAGASVPVTVRVALAAAAPNATMLLAGDLDFRVRLADASATGPDTTDETGQTDGQTDGQHDGADAGTGGGLLPDTGAAVRPGLVWLALALTILGGFLVARRRDRDDDPLLDHPLQETR